MSVVGGSLLCSWLVLVVSLAGAMGRTHCFAHSRIIARGGGIAAYHMVWQWSAAVSLPLYLVCCGALQVMWGQCVDLLQRGFSSGSILTVDPEDARLLGKPWTRRCECLVDCLCLSCIDASGCIMLLLRGLGRVCTLSHASGAKLLPCQRGPRALPAAVAAVIVLVLGPHEQQCTFLAVLSRRYIYNQRQCGRCRGPVKIWDMATRTVSTIRSCSLLEQSCLRLSLLAAVNGGAKVCCTCLCTPLSMPVLFCLAAWPGKHAPLCSCHNHHDCCCCPCCRSTAARRANPCASPKPLQPPLLTQQQLQQGPAASRAARGAAAAHLRPRWTQRQRQQGWIRTLLRQLHSCCTPAG